MRGGYDLVEVKSSTGVKAYHLEDAAVQTWVVRSAGVRLSRIQVAHIDNSFVYPGNENYQGLFAHSDITLEVHPITREVPEWVKAARCTLAGEEPDIEPGEQCHDPFECPFLTHCCPDADEEEDSYPPEILPYGKKIAATLRAEGFHDLRDVPEGTLTKAKHERIREASVTGKEFLDPQAGEILRAYPYPRYYLDFETIQFAVPIWTGTRPYQQLPFQWSCHRESANGRLQAGQYLASDAGDPRDAFLDSLLAYIKTGGPIFVYNAGFERSRLQELMEAFPDREDEIDVLCNRLVDLLPLARDYYYHPDMRGSWSIKKVLPTVAPEQNYDDLTVGDGGMAQQSYLEMLQSETPAPRREELRAALLAYCHQDTLALVRLARYFQDH